MTLHRPGPLTPRSARCPPGSSSSNGYVYCAGSDYDDAGSSIDYDGRRLACRPGRPIGARRDHDEPADDDEPVADDLPDALIHDQPAIDVSGPGPQERRPARARRAGPTDRPADDALIEVTDITDLNATDTWHGIFDETPSRTRVATVPGLAHRHRRRGPSGLRDGPGRLHLDRELGHRAGLRPGRPQRAQGGRRVGLVGPGRRRGRRAAASQIIGRFLATDEHGNEYAMARRLGARTSSTTDRSGAPRRPGRRAGSATPAQPDTDHVHLSFNRAGGRGHHESFWDVADLPEVSASDFGPYALLPDAGGVAANDPISRR